VEQTHHPARPDLGLELVAVAGTPPADAAEQVFQALLAQPTVGFALLDADLRYVLVNARLAQMNGLPLEEHPGRRIADVVPTLAERAADAFLDVLRTGRPMPELSFTAVLPAGSTVERHWVESAYPVRDATGTPVAVAVLVWEVTDRVEAERRRDQMLALLELLILRAPIGIAFLDRELRYVRINENLAAANGLPVQEHLGRPLPEVIPELAPQLLPDLHRVLETGRPIIGLQIETPPRPPDPDRRRHWQLSYYPVFPLGPGGEPAEEPEGIGVIVTDLTERVEAEQERARLLAAEREAARRAQHAAARQALLQRLTAALAEAMTMDDVAATMVAVAADALDASAATLALMSEDGQAIRVVATAGVDGSEVRPGATFRVADLPLLQEVLRVRRPVYVVSAAERDARYPEMSALAPGLEAWVNLLLVAHDEVLGMASFAWREPRQTDAAELELFASLALQCATALDRARLHEAERAARAEAERGRERLDLLARASDLLSRSLDEHEVLAELARLIIPEWSDWLVVLLPDGRGRLVPRISVHADPAWAQVADAAGATPLPVEADLPATRVFRTGKQLYTDDVRPYLLLPGTPGPVSVLAQQMGPSPGLLVPMVVRGRVIGVLSLVDTSGRPGTLGGDLELFADLARRAGIALDNARLYGQRTRVAARLQESLLPERLPPVPGVEVAVRYTTAEEAVDVGGDFYDLVALSEEEHFVVVGDVSGRGVDAAAVTGLARHTLRAFAHEFSPGEALARLGEVLHAQDAGERFVTAVAGRMRRTPTSLDVRLARAGHTHPLVVRAGGGFEHIRSEGALLGAFPGVVLEETRHELLPGDTLLLYTDGITEARRGDELFGEERVAAAAAGAAGAGAEATVEAVLAAVEAFRTAPAEDDTALLAVHVVELPPAP